ncbi:hypothetical protein [Flammeovirga sp. SJP92]|uniref:hypothetical protein n=1 Tax=Flammeovirga sp. SJP92 TaxID=1775430 RepID=UPI000788A6AF|nr:hypothetical protein [Flammeovirga sp. SJP92]KXX69124.1 hypothetical protein AVL50_16940 [Flammeovirga sp. SJP92]
MKLNPAIIFIFFLFSCQNGAHIEFGKKYKEKLLQINIDTLDSYIKLYNSVDSILCSNDESQIQLLIHDDEVNYKVNLINICSDIVGCSKSRNFLVIKNDSIYKSNIGAYNFDSLCNLIIRDYPNNGLNPRLSGAPHKFSLLFIQPNLLNNEALKGRLINTLKAFESTHLGNDKLKLALSLDINENFDFDKIQYEDSVYNEMEMLLKDQNLKQYGNLGNRNSRK